MSVISKLLGANRQPLPPLDLKHPLVMQLSSELRELHARPIGSKGARQIWELEARKMQARLHQEYAAVYDALPHELEHYLVDADIRAKDPSYARYQEDLLAALLSPADEKTA